MKTRVGFGV